jgi:hypothetical protein
MQDPTRRADLVSKPQLFLIVAALLLTSNGAWAQAGSAGGSIGQQNKSASGGQEESAKPRASRNVASHASRKSQSRAETGSAAAADGSWAGVSTGACIPNWSWTLHIDSGVISGNNVTGHIGRGGAASGTMTVLGTAYNFVGHFGATAGSGTWTTAAGCSGNWTGTKS